MHLYSYLNSGKTMNRTAVINSDKLSSLNTHNKPTLNLRSLTGNQRMVYETLLKLKRSAGAYELLELLRKKGINAAATVYRALNELTSKGLVKRLVSTRKFVAREKTNNDQEESLMLICRHCGEVSSLDDDNLVGMFDNNIAQSGYKVDSYHLELIVTCNGCNKTDI
jgi:Fur family transcriptional regulator, zinc uptake regulator